MDAELKEKSFAFSLRIVKLYRYLYEEKKEYVLSRQVFRSGTAVGALLNETELYAAGKELEDMLNKALISVTQTEYWLRLLKEGEYITEKMLDSIEADIQELLPLLKAALKPKKTAKKKTSTVKKKSSTKK